MDEQLFDGIASPYSTFRNVVGFFENPTCPARFKFRFMSGTLKDEIDDSVTHVFVEDNETKLIELVAARERSRTSERICVRIVKCRWIEECFRNGRVSDITDHLIDRSIDQVDSAVIEIVR